MRRNWLKLLSLFITIILCLQIFPTLAGEAEQTHPAYSLDGIPREWAGEYDGSSGWFLVVRRDYEIHIQDIDREGVIRGIAIISPSEKESKRLGANGSYYFKGKLDFKTGEISLQGYEWIQYPSSAETSNWRFIKLKGKIILSDEGAKIEGTSENGIWEMKAINYQKIKAKSGFKIGENSNSFKHDFREDVERPGFFGVENYSVDEEYYNKLIQHASQGEINKIKKAMQRKWGGSCFGIVSTMGLLYEGYIGINDLTDAKGKTNYYSLDLPYKDKKFLNMIQYFHLGQYIDSVYADARVSYTHNYGIMSGLVRWLVGYDSVPVFLKKMVNHIKEDHVLMLTYTEENSGHAVLVTGVSFDENSNTYQVQIYDENSADPNSDNGKFTTMTIAKDFSSFSFEEPNGHKINSNNFSSLSFLDWESMKNLITQVSGNYDKATRVIFNAGDRFRIENEDGKYLFYDGEIMKGDMPIQDFYTVADMGNEVKYVLTTEKTDSLKITEMGTNLDLEVYNQEEFLSVSGKNIGEASLDMDNGITLKGSNYQFETFVSTSPISSKENGLISVSGNATAEVKVAAAGDRVSISSDKEVTNVTTAAYTGTQSKKKNYSDTGKTFVVEKDAVIKTAKEVVPKDEVHFSKTKNYENGKFRDVTKKDWFYKNVVEAYELGLMVGKSESKFEPVGELTLAEAITLATRIHATYHGSGEELNKKASGNDAWYQKYLDYANSKGIIDKGYYHANVNAKANRLQFAEIMAKSLPKEVLKEINKIPSNAIPDVKSSEAKAELVYLLYRAGILSGSDAKGTFKPKSNISRAEVSAIVSRMVESNNRVKVRLEK